MEVICVLCDEKLKFAELLERDKSQMRGVRLDLAGGNTPAWRGESGIAASPHAVGTTKVRDAGVCADARARKGHQMLAVDYPTGDCLNPFFEELCFVHEVFLVWRYVLLSTLVDTR